MARFMRSTLPLCHGLNVLAYTPAHPGKRQQCIELPTAVPRAAVRHHTLDCQTGSGEEARSGP